MTYIIKKEDGNRRIDKFIKKMLFDAPASFIYKMIRKKDVKVNNKRVDINYIIQEGDKVDIYITDAYLKKFKEEKIIKNSNINLNIIYEDNNILVIDKPKGILVHNGDKKKPTLQDYVISYLVNKNEYDPNNPTNFTPSPAHRLDRNTSGIIIFGKNENTIQELQNLFEEHNQIEKRYLALVKGIINKEGIIKNYLLKDEKTSTVYITNKNKGKYACTEYKLKENINNKYSLVDVNLLTGRTHQIRVHMASINHPIIGDAKYGDFDLNKFFKKEFNLNNQFLHAYYFKFKELSNNLSYLSNKEFVSQLNSYYKDIIEKLKGDKK